MGTIRLGPNALIASDYGDEGSNNFEVLLLDGPLTTALFRDNSGSGWHTIGPVVDNSYQGPALMVGDLQKRWAPYRDFEALVVDRDGQVEYLKRNNGDGGNWEPGGRATTGCAGPVSLVRGYRREPMTGSSGVSVPNPPKPDGTDGGLTITNTPTVELSDHHNLEALVPKADGLHHCTKHMGVSGTWSDNGAIAGTGRGATGTLISSDYSHLEALVFEPDPDARGWGSLTLFWQDDLGQWHRSAKLEARALGPAGLIQSDYVRNVDHHNFEALVVELNDEDRPTLRQWVRHNANGVGSWVAGGWLFPELLPTGQVSLIQGNMGDQKHHGNFEALVVVDSGQVVHLWRDAQTLTWRNAGPAYP